MFNSIDSGAKGGLIGGEDYRDPTVPGGGWEKDPSIPGDNGGWNQQFLQ